MAKCVTGKVIYGTFAEALAAIDVCLERPELGAAYTCPECDGWHISSRRFTLERKRGRGKARRGVLRSVG